MRKFFCRLLFFLFLFLLFNIIRVTPVFANNLFKEGIYSLSDFNSSVNNIYSVQNISSDNIAYLLVFDENQVPLQTIKLEPKSSKYTLVPLSSDYKIVIVGNGEVFIS